MSTTIPPDNNVTADSTSFDWLHHLGGTWHDWRRKFSRKRTRQRLKKALGPERASLLWALPDVARGPSKQLILGISDWAASILHETPDPKAPKGTKAKHKSKAKHKTLRGRTLKGKTAKPNKKTKTLSAQDDLDDRVGCLRQWLSNIGQRPVDEAIALESLAWLRALPYLSEQLDPELWGELFDTLRHMAHDASGIPFGKMPLARQLFAGELPVTFACIFDDIDAFSEFAHEGLACVALGMNELLDGEGMLHARAIEHQRSLLACWARICRMVKHSSALEVDEEIWGQFEWLFRQAVRFTAHDGQQMLNANRSGRWDEELMRAAMKLDGDPADVAAAALLPWSEPIKKKQKSKAKLPAPGCYSEWAELGLLSAGWNPRDVRLALAFNDGQLRCQANGFGRTWFDGLWDFHLEVDQQPMERKGGLDETCWHSDEDVNYLELQATYADGWKVQRQILLDRRHQFLFVADAVLGDRASDLEVRTRLPLAGAVKSSPAKETREVTLKSGKSTVDVLPLALPEWRSDRCNGELLANAESIELRQQTHGTRLYAPLFIHFHPHRGNRLTWRRLTVASELTIQPPEVAAGYRVQFGEFQWVFFRSLADVKPRTMLGLHLNHEFYAGRFLPDGETDELIAIDPSS